LQPIQTGGSDVVPVEKQVLITLWYVGSLDTIRKIEDRFGVSESTVRMCRERVTGGAKIFGVFRVKNSIIRKNNHSKLTSKVCPELCTFSL
jgi:transposase